jgi:septal ring factor EnvC (AmiA/AmiB activator)
MTREDTTQRVDPRRRKRTSVRGLRTAAFIDDTLSKAVDADVKEAITKRAEDMVKGRPPSRPPLMNFRQGIDASLNALIQHTALTEAARLEANLKDQRAMIESQRDEIHALREQRERLLQPHPPEYARLLEENAKLRQKVARLQTQMADEARKA